MRALHIVTIVLTLACSAPAVAHEDRTRDPMTALEPGRLTQGSLRESDIALLLDYLRAAILAAAEGREPAPPPEELERRAQELSEELKARGTLAALLVLDALEKQARALMREGAPPSRRNTLPPTVPYTPVSSY